MHVSLYRRYRPGIFSEIVAQEAAVNLLRREISKGRNSHAYLFSGPRGCGKTTLARIVAKALNCPHRTEEGEPCNVCPGCLSIAGGENLDVVEIDGASNRGIDEIRELKEHISLCPFSGKYKVYIIDEVHMLTDPAFNALLKTLEEPPQTVVFILATTEPHKVPATIRSRCQHIPFHRIPVTFIVECLERVAGKEGSTLEKDALWEIARESDGSLRDALSLLEQALGTGLTSVSLQDIRGILGGGGRSDLEKLAGPLREGSPEALVRLEDLLERGMNAERFLEGMFLLFRDLLVAARWGEDGIRSLPLGEGEKDFLRKESKQWKEKELWRILEFCTRTLPRARFGLKSEVAFGMFLGLFCFGTAGDEVVALIEDIPEAGETEIPAPVSMSLDKASEPEAGETEIPAPASISLDPVPELEAGNQDPVERPALKGWAECVERISEHNMPLYCACVQSSAVEEDDMVSIVFPENFRFSFDIASSQKNIACLDSIRDKHFPGKEMRIVCGVRSVKVLPVTGNQECGQAEEVHEVAFKPAKPSRSMDTAESRSPAGNKNIEAAKDVFGEVQRCFNAELLVFREENPEISELPEGTPEEQ